VSTFVPGRALVTTYLRSERRPASIERLDGTVSNVVVRYGCPPILE
jgi:hypothetical protein